MGLKCAGLDIPGYIDSLPSHSDFRKFDGTLRMVIDCTPGMRAAVRTLLERERAAGTIYFGLHASSNLNPRGSNAVSSASVMTMSKILAINFNAVAKTLESHQVQPSGEDSMHAGLNP